MLALVEKPMTNINIGMDGGLWYTNYIWVPENSHLKEQILIEAHKSKYTFHPGSTRMY